MTEFDPSKPVMTRDGRSVRLLPERAKNPSRPLVGLVLNELGYEFPDSWSEDGKNPNGASNLVNIPESKWMNLYDDPSILPNSNFYCQWEVSRSEADKVAERALFRANAKRIAITELTASSEFITTAVEK